MKAVTKGYYRYSFFLLMLYLIFPGCSPDKELKFTFNRKDGETYIQRLSVSSERHMGPTNVQMDDTLSVTKVTCKKTVDGWDIDSQPLSRTIMRNGKELKNPLLDLLSGFVITYKLDMNGELKDILGYEKVVETIHSQYPSDVADGLTSSLDVDSLKQREFSEWNGRIGNFINKEFSIGDVWEFKTPFTLPNGVNLTYKGKTHFKELVMYKDIKCVLIEQTYDSTGEGMSDLINDVAQSVSKGEEDDKNVLSLKESKVSSSIKGKLTRVIDPATMHIYREDAERIIYMEMDIPGAGRIPVKITETRSYEYEYNN